MTCKNSSYPVRIIECECGIFEFLPDFLMMLILGIEEFAPRILPSLILLFDGLKRAYEAQKDADDSDDRYVLE